MHRRQQHATRRHAQRSAANAMAPAVGKPLPKRPPLGRRGDLPVVLGALTGGLLSSSCCVIQLVLNSLSVGCATEPLGPGCRNTPLNPDAGGAGCMRVAVLSAQALAAASAVLCRGPPTAGFREP